MDIKHLKTDILSNKTPHFLIFVAKEKMLCRQYIEKIRDTIGKPLAYYYSADDAIVDLSSPVRDEFLYVIKDDNILKKDTYAETLTAYKNKYIVLMFDELLSSSNLYKQYKDNVVTFNPLDAYTLCAYFTKKLKDAKIALDQDKIFKVIEYCENDLGKCINEFDKIITLGQDNSNRLADYMFNNGFSDYRGFNMWKFVDMVVNKNSKALDYANFAESENPVTIVYNIYNSARRKLVENRDNSCVDTMKVCNYIYSGIVDGTFNQRYALRYLLYEVFAN